MELLTRYKAVRIQWHGVLFASKSLTSTEKLIAGYLVDVRLNFISGQLNPSVKRIAEDVDTSTRTVQRCVNKLMQDGWFDVQRGNGRGNFGRYEFALPGILKAEAEKEKTDTPVTLSGRKGRHQCRERVTEAAQKGRHESRHNSITKKYKKSGAINEGTEEVIFLNDGLIFVPSGSCFDRYWSDRFVRLGLERLGKSIAEKLHRGERGYWLPEMMPAPLGSNAWEDQLAVLRRLIGGTEGKQVVA